MKRFISIILLAALCLCLTACGKTQAAKDWEASVAAIGTDISYESAEAIAKARQDYNALSADEQKSVKIEKLEAIEEEFFALPNSPLQCAEYLRSQMKDPSSFRIYSEVIFVIFYDIDTGELKAYYTELGAAAKNSYGGYNGVTWYDVFVLPDGEKGVFPDTEDYYADWRSIMTNEGLFAVVEPENRPIIAVFDGAQIAELMDCEYYG